jgi:hypothetical protein
MDDRIEHSLSQPTIIDCCDSFYLNNIDGAVSPQHQQQMNQYNFILEVKIEQLLQVAKEEWNAKCEHYDKTINALSKELLETKMQLQSIDRINSNESATAYDDTNLPYTLKLNTDLLRGNENSDTESNKTHDSSCFLPESNVSSGGSYDDDTTATPVSIEQLIRKELRSYMKGVLAERESHTYLLLREMEKQEQKNVAFRNDILNQLHELTMEKGQDQTKIVSYTNLDTTHNQIIDNDGDVQSILTVEQENQIELVNVNIPVLQYTNQMCTELIQKESERLMKTWGTQFDELAVYLQDNLDSQRVCIAEARTSTFEHVDAESHTRAGVWKAQFNHLLRKNQQQENAMHEIRGDQEQSFLIIVDTLIKLKTKLNEITEQVKDFEMMHLSSEIDIQTIRYDFHDESNIWKLKFIQSESKFQSLKDSVNYIVKEVDAFVEDRDSIQKNLSATIELINSKLEAQNEMWQSKLTNFESRFENQAKAGQLQIQNLNSQRLEVEVVISAICKKLVDLAADVDQNQRQELESLLAINKNGEKGSKESLTDNNNDTRVKYIKVDQKKYKKAIWCARQQQCKNRHVGDIPRNEIEFYDLTFAISATNE